MKQFKIENKDYSIKSEWNELTVADFITIEKHKRNKQLFEHDEFWAIRLFELLTTSNGAEINEGELDNLKLSDLTDVLGSLNFLKEPFKSELNRFIEIEGEKWAFPERLEDLTTGEYISIKTIQESGGDDLDILINTLSVILRKCVEDAEGNIIIENFNPKKMEEKKAIILKGSAIKIVGYLDFFFSGKMNSTKKDIENSLTKEDNQEE